MTADYCNNNFIITDMNSVHCCTQSAFQYNIVKSKFLIKIGLCIDIMSKYRKLFIKMCVSTFAEMESYCRHLNHAKTDVIYLLGQIYNKHQYGT